MSELVDNLGIISTAPPTPMAGDMIQRSVAGGWTTFNPGGAGAVLGIDKNSLMPVWFSRSWVGLPYSTSWANYGAGFQAGQYSLSADNEVVVRGLVHKSSSWILNDTIATLPVGARPALDELFVCLGYDSTNGKLVFRVDVTSQGAIILRDVAHGTTPITRGQISYMPLSGIRFQQGG